MKKILVSSIIALTVALVGAASANAAFTRNLTVGSTGTDVAELQTWLISKGFSIPSISSGAATTGYFGQQTKMAVAAYQATVGLPNQGFFGPLTMAKIAMGGTTVVTVDPSTCPSWATCTAKPGTTPSTPSTPVSTTLTGGAGSASYSTVSGLSNEEVGEDEEDVKVAGLEIEADQDSDIMLTAVKVVFNEGTANQDFDEYAEEVSIWLGDKEYARVDASEFTDETGTANDWTKTISLKKGAIIRSGDTEDLFIKVTGISNLDSTDAGDTWTADFVTVRFEDATGVSVSDSVTYSEVTFSFDTFASASDLEMTTNLSSSNPEEGIVIVDNDGDDIHLLTFKIKAEGSAITIKEIPVALTGVNLANIDTLADELVLTWSGDDAKENIPSSSGTTELITFDDLDIEVAEGKTVEFTVKAKSATSTISDAQGITLAAVITPDDIVAEDNTGEDIADGDSSGSVTGETMHVFGIAPEITIVSTSIATIDNGTAPAESAEAIIVAKVKALGGTIYLNGDNESTENKKFFVGQVYGQNNTASTTASSTDYTIGGQYTVTNSGADNEYYTINEGDTMTITIKSTVSQSTVTTTAISAGLKAALFQYGIVSTDDSTRSAIDINWADMTDKTQTGTKSLVNPS